VRFEVLTAASIKMTVFWVAAPCSLVEFYRRYRGAIIALMMEAASTSETLVNFYQTTRRKPEDSHLQKVLFLSNTKITKQVRKINLITEAVPEITLNCLNHTSLISEVLLTQ
jgi:hypothetical protein